MGKARDAIERIREIGSRNVSVDGTKLDNIEIAADVTDPTNVDTAGAVMNSDTSTSEMIFVIDEDTLVTNSATKVPTQQSVKAYVDGKVASSVEYVGSYDASTNTPNLDTTPTGITKGDMYTVTVAGALFFSETLEIGDVLISEQDDPTTTDHWTIVNKNLDAASIKSSYESNAQTNAFTDAQVTNLGNQSGTNTGDNATNSNYSGLATNVSTDLSKTATTTDVTINSSDGNNVAIGEATTLVAGLMTKAMYDEHVINTAKVSDIDHNITTDLGYTTAATTGTVTSSDGTDATLPAATTTLAGLLIGTDKGKLDGIATGATANGTVTGSGTTSGDNTGDNATNTQYSGLVSVPPTGTTNDGKLLTAGSTEGSASWQPAPVSLPVQTGQAGKSLTTDGTAASWETTGTADFVASGVLPNGAPVILKADGTVEVAGTTSPATGYPEAIPAGSAADFFPSSIDGVKMAYDPLNAGKFVVVYGTNSYLYAIVGTVSGVTISFGSNYLIDAGVFGTARPKLAFDPINSGKFAVVFRERTTYEGVIVIGSISGTAISFGTRVIFETGSTWSPSVAFDPNQSNMIIISYQDQGNNSYGTAIIGSISGTTVSFYTPVIFNSVLCHTNSVAFDPHNAGQLCIVYQYTSTSCRGVVGTLTGSTLTFGNVYTLVSQWIQIPEIEYDPNPANAGKLILAYEDMVSPKTGGASVLNINGGVITVVAIAVFSTTEVANISLSFDPNKFGRFLISYRDIPANNIGDSGIVREGTLVGSNITLGNVNAFQVGNSSYMSVAFDPNTEGEFVASWYNTVSIKGQSVVNRFDTFIPAVSNLTSTNFLGTSTTAYTNAQTATIMLKGGVSTNQTALTVGSTYYVLLDGTLSTTAAAGSVTFGKALSATSVLLDDGSINGTLDFANFSVNATTGMLEIDYYGNPSNTNFSINANGELEVIV